MMMTMQSVRLLLTSKPTHQEWIDAAVATVPRVQCGGNICMDVYKALWAVQQYCQGEAERNRELMMKRTGASKGQLQYRAGQYDARAETAAHLLTLSEFELEAICENNRQKQPKQTRKREPPKKRLKPNTDADPELYREARIFVDKVRRSRLTAQQKLTLIGQACSGDIDGARRGYDKLAGRQT